MIMAPMIVNKHIKSLMCCIVKKGIIMINKTGNIINWEEKDDTQKLMTIAEQDAATALNTALEYEYVSTFINENLDYVNRAVHFWSETLKALRYSMIMQSARLFDKTKGVISMERLFNKIEQNQPSDATKQELLRIKTEYTDYEEIIGDIRTLRDKIYAHNDSAVYQWWKNDISQINELEFDMCFQCKLIELLKWAKGALLALRSTWGDSYPIHYEITNDVCYVRYDKNNEQTKQGEISI